MAEKYVPVLEKRWQELIQGATTTSVIGSYVEMLKNGEIGEIERVENVLLLFKIHEQKMQEIAEQYKED